MNTTTKNYILQKAISQVKGYNIQYKQRQKVFYIDEVKYTFKNGLVKLQDILKNERS